MFGKKKHIDENEEMMVSETDTPMPEAMPMPIPEPEYVPASQYSQSSQYTGQAAPMFVKVEKYREIIDALQEIKNFVNGIKQLFVVISEIENIRNDALRIMRVSVQRLEKGAIEIDHELLRPIGFETYPHGEAERGHVEESLTELQDQIAKLRGELEQYKGR